MRRVLWVVVVVSLAGLASLATEPKSDLSLEVRVVDTAMSQGGWGKPARGVARIEVSLDAVGDAQDVELTLTRPDGRPLPLRPTWRNALGLEVVAGSRGIMIPARGRIVTRLEVPLEGTAMHPVLVRAKARVGTLETSTEGFAFVPAGTPRFVVEESPDGQFANFPVKGVE